MRVRFWRTPEPRPPALDALDSIMEAVAEIREAVAIVRAAQRGHQ